jgi:hypothetical protein
MTPKDPNGEPTSVDRWNHAVRQAYGGGGDALVDEVLAMSDVEVEAELAQPTQEAPRTAPQGFGLGSYV